MLGEPDPFKLASKISRRTFIWWRVYQQLRLSELHEKWEYYAAAIRADIRSAFSESPVEIESMLLRMESRTVDEIEEEQTRQDEAFMAAAISTAEKLAKTNNRRK